MGLKVNGAELITQSEYARRRGVAKSAVAKAVSERRITLVDGKIDPVIADIQWQRNTRARGDSGKASTAPDAMPQMLTSALATREPDQKSPPSPADEGDYAFNRARRECYEADLAKLKLLEQQGDLVRVAEVRAEMAKQIGELKTNLLQIRARLGHLLTPEAGVALDIELRNALSNAGNIGQVA